MMNVTEATESQELAGLTGALGSYLIHTGQVRKLILPYLKYSCWRSNPAFQTFLGRDICKH